MRKNLLARAFELTVFYMRFALLLFLLITPVAAQMVKVPTGKPVMIDGKISAGEWSDARRLALDGGNTLYVKRCGEHVALAIQFAKPARMSVDLLLASDDVEVTDLHASAKLGERIRERQGTFPDWNWWNNSGWTANVTRAKTYEPPEFLPDSAKEFQIYQSKFPTKIWRLRVELNSDDIHAFYPTPPSSDRDGSGWITLQF